MLVTLLEIKEFLKIKLDNDSEDDRLNSINGYVSSLVESYCGRAFASNTYTEYFDGGITSVFIKNPPIISVNEVSQFLGDKYDVLGGPGPIGQQVDVDGSSHIVSAQGDAKTTKRIKKYGTSSLILDGTGDHLSVPSSEDFDFGSDPFTLELYTRPKSLSDHALITRVDDSSNYWELSYDNTNGVIFRSVESGVETNYVQGDTLTVNTFAHLALVRDDSEFKIYKDGTQIGFSTASSNTIPNLNSSLEIGRINISGSEKYYNGNIDELRVSWIDRYSSNFTSLISPLTSDEDTKLLLHFNEGQNKNNIIDFSRKVNEYIWYSDTGEINFDSGRGGGTPRLGFFSPRQFANYANGVRVNYTGGYANVPSDLKLAALEMVKVLYKGREGAKTVRLQGDDSTSHDLSMDGFPPQIRRVLNLYRLPM